ncbi:GIY-YIG nuclease family protein [Streptomyces sp. NPDC050121]|uniref:GIY-YIG nuclease family protein n=1 Tax=Streptomyces sp. NPDC050121 TaxID=3365601 RepID=UPI00378E53CD
MPTPDMNERTALYRLFDRRGGLLYVGITNDPAFRWKQHRGDKGWWPKVADKQVTWYATRALALQAEALAIHTEGPAFNTVRPHLIAHVPEQMMTTAEVSKAEAEIRAATERRARAVAAFERDDTALRELFVAWRAQGVGPSDMARWSGMTREWVAKIAPAPKS